jgi:hypothetical protein
MISLGSWALTYDIYVTSKTKFLWDSLHKNCIPIEFHIHKIVVAHL